MSSAATPSFVTVPWAGRARRWRARLAATRLLHSRAVILDVETTGFEGRVCEIAILDTTGRILLETLVDPRVPVPAIATTVHGITSHDLTSAPTWAEIAPRVDQLLTGRTVIAYNAPFDQGRVRAEQLRAGRSTAIAETIPWWCLMRARAMADNGPWRPLDGGHRAAGDCRAALTVLHDLALTTGPRPREEGTVSARHVCSDCGTVFHSTYAFQAHNC